MFAANDTPLLRAILAEPANTDVRLVYCDWLEDHGQLALASVLRTALECVIEPLRGGVQVGFAFPARIASDVRGSSVYRRFTERLAALALEEHAHLR